MTTLYPNGYGTSMVTIERMRELHEPHMHPEFAHRFFPYIVSQGGQQGVGGGFRTTQPTLSGFAPDGQSFHQAQRWRSGIVGYDAIDVVVAVPGRIHRSPYWSEVPAQGTAWASRCGIHFNVTGESWHCQCTPIDGWTSWANAGRWDPQANFPVPGVWTPPPPPPPSPYDAGVPVPTLRFGSNGPQVGVLIGILQTWKWYPNTTDRNNSDFGNNTKAGLEAMQRAFHVAADGVYGPQTAGALQSYLRTVHAPLPATCEWPESVADGMQVAALQQRLNAWAFLWGGSQLAVDGKNGPATKAEVAKAQGYLAAVNRLAPSGVDGDYGPITRLCLCALTADIGRLR